MLGKNVVYVTERCNAEGGVFHKPSHNDQVPHTRCGEKLQNPTLMQRQWAEHTQATPCPACYPGIRESEKEGE